MNPSNNRTGQLKFNNKHLVSVSHAAATIALAAAAPHLAALAALSPDLALAAALKPLTADNAPCYQDSSDNRMLLSDR